MKFWAYAGILAGFLLITLAARKMVPQSISSAPVPPPPRGRRRRRRPLQQSSETDSRYAIDDFMTCSEDLEDG